MAPELKIYQASRCSGALPSFDGPNAAADHVHISTDIYHVPFSDRHSDRRTIQGVGLGIRKPNIRYTPYRPLRGIDYFYLINERNPMQ